MTMNSNFQMDGLSSHYIESYDSVRRLTNEIGEVQSYDDKLSRAEDLLENVSIMVTCLREIVPLINNDVPEVDLARSYLLSHPDALTNIIRFIRKGQGYSEPMKLFGFISLDLNAFNVQNDSETNERVHPLYNREGAIALMDAAMAFYGG